MQVLNWSAQRKLPHFIFREGGQWARQAFFMYVQVAANVGAIEKAHVEVASRLATKTRLIIRIS